MSAQLGQVKGQHHNISISRSIAGVELDIWGLPNNIPAGHNGFGDAMTPDAARGLAALLCKAADDVERRRSGPPMENRFAEPETTHETTPGRANVECDPPMTYVRTTLVQALIDSLPKCDLCGKPATRAHGRGGPRFCDECTGSHVSEYPRAAPLRAVIAELKRIEELKRVNE